MKTAILAFCGFIFVGGLLFVAWHFISTGISDANDMNTNTSSNTATNGFPVSNTTASPGVTAQAEVMTKDGGTLPVNDISQDSGAVQDPSGEQYYSLSGGTDPEASGAPYEITYDADSSTFSIILHAEPIGQNRLAAQAALAAKLGISQDQLCELNEFVVVAPGVNDTYLHQNLGFEGCQGAVSLPQ